MPKRKYCDTNPTLPAYKAIQAASLFRDSLYESWRALGNFLHRCKGASAHVLCGDPSLTRHLGLRADQKFPVHNGPIECRWLRYEVGEAED